MKKLALTLATSLIGASTILVATSCEQPAVLCTCGRGDFAAMYTFVEGSPTAGTQIRNPRKERLRVRKDAEHGKREDWRRAPSPSVASVLDGSRPRRRSWSPTRTRP